MSLFNKKKYKNMKSNIIAEFNNIIKSHNKSPFRFNEVCFQEFINGLYQAEGTMGAYFPKKDSLRVVYSFSIGQNYSPEALDVLLSLQKILGVGRVILEFNLEDQPHIRYKVSNTQDIFKIIIPYFSLLYGQKRKDISTLKRIYQLYSNKIEYFKLDNLYASELIHLVYSINPYGQRRKFSLAEKLNMFNCSLLYEAKCYNLEVKDNNNLPGKLFIIGLFLGDGTMS
jgi:hypothetical protein